MILYIYQGIITVQKDKFELTVAFRCLKTILFEILQSIAFAQSGSAIDGTLKTKVKSKIYAFVILNTYFLLHCDIFFHHT